MGIGISIIPFNTIFPIPTHLPSLDQIINIIRNNLNIQERVRPNNELNLPKKQSPTNFQSNPNGIASVSNLQMLQNNLKLNEDNNENININNEENNNNNQNIINNNREINNNEIENVAEDNVNIPLFPISNRNEKFYKKTIYIKPTCIPMTIYIILLFSSFLTIYSINYLFRIRKFYIDALNSIFFLISIFSIFQILIRLFKRMGYKIKMDIYKKKLIISPFNIFCCSWGFTGGFCCSQPFCCVTKKEINLKDIRNFWTLDFSGSPITGNCINYGSSNLFYLGAVKQDNSNITLIKEGYVIGYAGFVCCCFFRDKLCKISMNLNEISSKLNSMLITHRNFINSENNV